MNDNWRMVLVAFFACVPPTLCALAVLLRLKPLGQEVHQINRRQNGLLDALLAEARDAGYRSGFLAGKCFTRPIEPPPAAPPPAA